MVNVISIQPSTVFAWFMFLLVLRRLVLIILTMILGYNKPFVVGSRPPEDRMFKRGQVEHSSSSSSIVAVEFSKDVRINKVIHNDAENDFYFLILYLATAIYTDSLLSRDCTRTVIYGTIYLFFRLGYTIAYIFALQPWRTLCFFCGLLCTFAMSLDLLITLSRQPN